MRALIMVDCGFGVFRDCRHVLVAAFGQRGLQDNTLTIRCSRVQSKKVPILCALSCPSAEAAAGAMVEQQRLGVLRDAFRNGHTRSVDWRIAQLKSVLRLVQEREAEIVEAISQDIGKPAFETYIAELALTSQSCKTALKEIRKWATPEKVSTALVSFPATAEIVPEPLGVVLVISAWNFPFLLAMDPVIGAIAAGNAVVLKPSELAPATSSLLAKLVPLYLDKAAICVVQGGIPETTALLEQQWDKIFYTGSTRVGKIVMAAAAKYLTPVVLELGGKSPVIVDSTVDLKTCARRIAFGKWANNNAQACISPDYILAEASIASKLVSALKRCLIEFYGEDPSKSKDMSRVVNSSHFSRLLGLMDEEKVNEKIVFGGERDEKRLYIAPTVILDPPLDSGIMSEEIFGPLLPIITVESVDSAIGMINSRPKPLALYLFSRDKSVQNKVVTGTSAGGMVVNDTVLHFMNETLPFGGVGDSGMGSYHGKFSFDAFSHKKAVLYRSMWGDVPAKYPPYTSSKQKLVRSLLEGDYFGLLKAALTSLWPSNNKYE